jgi:DNA polymerase-3 subunit epsilon
MQTIIIILLLGVIIYGYFRYVRKPKTEARPYSFVETPKIQEEPEAEQVKEEIISGTDCYTKRLRKTKRPLTFTAIDFETATTSRMACQLGIVTVENGEIVREKEYMIQPPGNQYDRRCVNVHHISPSMTANSPTFGELWPEIAPLLEDKTLVAHNLSFDLDVLNKNLAQYGIQNLDMSDSFCSCDDLGRATLFSACKYFGIPLEKRHGALEDARACAKLVLAYRDLAGTIVEIPKVEEVEEKQHKEVSEKVEVTIPDSMFNGKKVVISGVFNKWPDREELKLELERRGCRVVGSVSSKTDYLIIGEMPGPSKLEKAQELGITIIREDELQP